MNALIDTLMIAGGESALREYMQRTGLPFEISDSTDDDRHSFSVVLPLRHSLKSA